MQELAARLLRKRHAKRDWAAGYDAFWASVPPVGSVYAKENWRAEHVAALQDQKLASPLLCRGILMAKGYSRVCDQSMH